MDFEIIDKGNVSIALVDRVLVIYATRSSYIRVGKRKASTAWVAYNYDYTYDVRTYEDHGNRGGQYRNYTAVPAYQIPAHVKDKLK